MQTIEMRKTETVMHTRETHKRETRKTQTHKTETQRTRVLYPFPPTIHVSYVVEEGVGHRSSSVRRATWQQRCRERCRERCGEGWRERCGEGCGEGRGEGCGKRCGEGCGERQDGSFGVVVHGAMIVDSA